MGSVPLMYQGSKYKPGVLVPIPPEPSADPIGDTLRADAVAYYILGTNGNDSTPNHFDLTGSGSFVDDWYIPAGGSLTRDEGVSSLLVAGNIDFSLCYECYLGDDNDSEGVAAFSNGPTCYELDAVIKLSPGLSFDKQGDSGAEIFISTPTGSLSKNILYTLFAWYTAVDQTAYIQIGDGSIVTGSFDPGTTITNDAIVFSVYGSTTAKIRRIGFWRRVFTQDEHDYLYNSGTGRALFPAP